MTMIKRYLSFLVVALFPLTPFICRSASADAHNPGSTSEPLQADDTQKEAPAKQKKKKPAKKKAKKELKNKSEKNKDKMSKKSNKSSKKKNKKDTKKDK